MKKLLITSLVLILGTSSAFGQCSINQFIQDNYERDARVLAMRAIINNPSYPDYDNPYPSNDRIVPLLERLSALYENPHNSATIDAIFNDFRIHVNEEYMFPIEFHRMLFTAETS